MPLRNFLVSRLPIFARSSSAKLIFFPSRFVAPAFANYEIELTIDSFDDKWFYICANFITRPTKKKVSSSIPSSPSTKSASLDSSSSSSLLHPPRPALSRTNTPLPPSRSDGAVVHATAVSAHVRSPSPPLALVARRV